MAGTKSISIRTVPRVTLGRKICRSLRAPLALGALAIGLAACSGQMRFPVDETNQAALATQNINVVRMTPENIGQYRVPSYTGRYKKESNPPANPKPYTYRVGAGDEILINVWSDPERSQAATQEPNERGLVVNEAGNVFYPYVGSIHVAGKTTTQIRNDLSQKMRAFITDPQVEVSIASFNAHSATVTGRVGSPGPTKLTNVPLRLLDLINAASSPDDADLSRIKLRRRGRTHTVDLQAFVEKGVARQNPIILPGDLINVPTLADNKIFTFGEIATSEIPLGSTPKALTEILAGVGGIDRIRADARGVFVFRRTPTTPDGFDVFQFDLRSATALVLATDFQMAPLDIVFVTNDPITRWNDTVGSVVTPFTGLLQVRRLTESI